MICMYTQMYPPFALQKKKNTFTLVSQCNEVSMLLMDLIRISWISPSYTGEGEIIPKFHIQNLKWPYLGRRYTLFYVQKMTIYFPEMLRRRKISLTPKNPYKNI